MRKILLLIFSFSIMGCTNSLLNWERNKYKENKIYSERYYTVDKINQSDKNSYLKADKKTLKFAKKLQESYKINRNKSIRFADWIMQASKEHGIKKELIAGVISVESGFRYQATSVVGAVGPAQIRPKYWSKYCSSLYIPAHNINCGAKIIKKYLGMCNGKLKCALTYYNVGPTNAKKRKMRKIGKKYYKKVKKRMKLL